MADAYDLSVKANRLGHELGDLLGDARRAKLVSKILTFVQSEDMRTLAELMTDFFSEMNIDVSDITDFLRDRKNPMEERTSIGSAFALGVRGPIKRRY